jgi:membrane protease YdiL (CAAX protease family)
MPPADTDSSTVSNLVNLALFVWGALIWWRFQFVSSTAEFRVHRLPPTHISLAEFVFKVVVLLVGAFAGSYVGTALGHLAPLSWRSDPAFATFSAGAGFDIGGIAALLAFRRTPRWVLPQTPLPLEFVAEHAGLSAPAAELTAPPLPRRQILKAGFYTYLAAIVAVIVAQQVWFFILDKLHIAAPRQEVVDLLKGDHSSPTLAVAGLLTVVIGPILEEMVFRAGIFRYGKQILPRWAAFLISAVGFGLAHTSVSACVPLIIFAYVLALSYERTGRIGVTMIAHGLFNLTSFAALLMGWDS